jgi:hypothetical protein
MIDESRRQKKTEPVEYPPAPPSFLGNISIDQPESAVNKESAQKMEKRETPAPPSFLGAGVGLAKPHSEGDSPIHLFEVDMHRLSRFKYKLSAWSGVLFAESGRTQDPELSRFYVWLGARLFDLADRLNRLKR